MCAGGDTVEPEALPAQFAGPVATWCQPVPAGPPPPLYPFQVDGVQFLAERPAALLCDEMGLGKSIQAIVAAQRLFESGKIQRVLVLCPKTLLWDWWRKFRRWAPELQCCLLSSRKPRSRLFDWHWGRAQVFVAGYETWRSDHEQVQTTFELVILDEIQRIKNADALVSRAVHRLQAPWRWGLSGTPMENRLEDLDAVFTFIKPDLLGGQLLPSTAVVRETIRPFVLRRGKAEVLPFLPPKQMREEWLELTPEQKQAYAAAEACGLGGLSQVGTAGMHAHLLALLTRLKEICNLEPTSGASAKLAFLLAELPEILACDEKVLVFSQYPEKTLTPLLPRLLPYGACLFSGSLSQWERDEVVRRFEEEDWPRVLLVSLKAGGVGLTLTRANHVYHFDHWWNPAVMSQAEDRVHRIGQHRAVTITSLLTRGTVEEKIHRLLADKRRLFAEVMDGLDAPRLDGEALLHLFGMEKGRPGIPSGLVH